jgi:hypothetical protein
MSETTTKATPGPWKVGKPETNIMSEIVDIPIIAGKWRIGFANRFLKMRQRRAHELSMEEVSANAQLFASSPDLLAACQMALDRSEMEIDEFRNKYPEATENFLDSHVVMTLRAAIAKARAV